MKFYEGIIRIIINVKVSHTKQIIFVLGSVFLLTPFIALSQDATLNKYGLWVINKPKQLQKTIKKNSDKQMVDIKIQIPSIVLDLRYSTTNNFTAKKMYPPIPTTYVRWPVANALQKIQEKLNSKGLGIKIYDAYRPYAITEKMWQLVQDDRYAANPKYGSGHNRGVAVDVTIINLNTNLELNMGTDFDNFSDTAHHNFKNLSAEINANRFLLKQIMEQHGFKALDTEWWHYSLPNAKDFELLDLNFKVLKKTAKKNDKQKFN